MALIIGEKSKIEITKERESKVEKLSQISLMTSGIKIRQAAADKLGIKGGDNVWFVADVENGKIQAVFIYKATEKDSNKLAVSNNNTFMGKDFRNALLDVAKIERTDFKAKDTVTFEVSDKPTKFEGRDLYQLTLVSYKKAEDKTSDELEETHVAAVAVETEEEL